MKSFVKFATAAVALSFAQQASADVTVRITGSTAFRAATHRAIVAAMGGDTSTTIAHSGTGKTQGAMEGASSAVFRGTVSSISGTTTVLTSWSGSVEGIQTLTSNGNLSYVPATALSGATGTGVANANDAEGLSETTNGAHFAMSDVFQNSTEFTTPGLEANQVGVIPFCWVANRGTTGITNVTAQQLNKLYADGLVRKSLFTGNVADDPINDGNTDPTIGTGTYVVATGRNKLSGTRLTAMAETKIGVFSLVNQYAVVTSGSSGSGTITRVQRWPIQASDSGSTNPGGYDASNPGNGGYTGSGSVRALLGFASSSVNLFDEVNSPVFTGIPLTVIAYLGSGDTDVATNGTNQAVRLSYEGSLYSGSADDAKIHNGLYTFWGYEVLLNTAGLSTDEETLRTALIGQMDTSAVLGTSGIRLGLMNVNRQTDGAVVGH